MESVEALHTPEFQVVTLSGKVFTRERYVSAVNAQPFYTNWDVGDMNVRVSSGMAIVRYQARLQFPCGRVALCWHTDSYEKRGLHWQAV